MAKTIFTMKTQEFGVNALKNAEGTTRKEKYAYVVEQFKQAGFIRIPSLNTLFGWPEAYEREKARMEYWKKRRNNSCQKCVFVCDMGKCFICKKNEAPSVIERDVICCFRAFGWPIMNSDDWCEDFKGKGEKEA